MMPHPSTDVASAEEHRQDLLSFAARERLTATVPHQAPRPPRLAPVWGLIPHVIRMMRAGLSAQPRPRVWSQA
jgi:hypothetical protein